MTILQLQCFCAIVKYGSYSRAADALFMSQSSVSKHMAALEEECGFPLIIKKKTNNQIVLSMEGQLMLRDCNKVLVNFEQLQHLMKEMRKKPLLSTMSFSLMGIPEMAYYGVIASINEFNSIYAGTSIHIVEADEFFARLAILNEETDVAFISDIGLDHTQFSWQDYCEERLAVAVSVDNPLAGKEKIYMKDLSGYTMIAPPKKTNLLDFCIGAFQNIGKFEPQFEFLTSRPSSALDYIYKHPDIVYLTAERVLNSIPADTRGKYKVIRIINSPTFHYAFAWRKEKILSEKVRQYLKTVTALNSQKFIDAYWNTGEKYME